MSYQWVTLSGYLNDFVRAAWLTLQVTLLAFVVAMLLGLLAALASTSRVAVLRAISSCYIEVIRNTPVLLPLGSSLCFSLAFWLLARLL